MTGARSFTELLFVGLKLLLLQIHDRNKSFYFVTFCWAGTFTYSNPLLEPELLQSYYLLGWNFYLFKSMTGARAFTELLFIGPELLLIQIHDLTQSFYRVTICWAGIFTYSNP